MQIRTRPWIVIGLFASLPLALVTAGCAKQQEGVAVQQPPPATVTPSQVARAVETLPQPDQDFIRQAAGANMAAIRFGQLAAQRGSTETVRRLATDLVNSNTALNDQLRESARREGIVLPIAPMTPEQAEQFTSLQQLTGPAFDQAWLRAVMDIQQQTIASFQNEAVHGQQPGLAQFANQLLPSLNERARFVQRQAGLM